MALRPKAGHYIPIIELSIPHTTTHHSQQDPSGLVISSSQRPPPDNTQHSQPIRSHNLSRPAAAAPPLRPRGHWDRQFSLYSSIYVQTFAFLHFFLNTHFKMKRFLRFIDFRSGVSEVAFLLGHDTTSLDTLYQMFWDRLMVCNHRETTIQWRSFIS
jgi:hypothetical protein